MASTVTVRAASTITERSVPEGARPIPPASAERGKDALAQLPPLRLPTNHSRSAAKAFREAWEPVAFPRSLSESLKSLSERQGVSLSVTILAAFQVLLSRYTSQHEIAVGLPAGDGGCSRDGNGNENTAGIVAWVGNLSGNPPFSELMRRLSADASRVRLDQLDRAGDWSEAPLPGADSNVFPMLQVFYSFTTRPLAGDSGWDSASAAAELGKTNFDLFLELQEGAEGFVGKLHYNAELFEKEAIRRMVGHLQRVCEGIGTEPERRLSALPLLTDRERHQILLEWNDTKVDYARDLCIHQLIEAQAERTPGAVAVVCGDQQLAYDELNARANQLAHHLAKRGVGPDVPVGICLERSLELTVALLGVLKAGGACLPLDPRYPKERLVYMQEDAKAPVILTQPSLLPEFANSSSQMVCLSPGLEIIAQENRGNFSSGAKSKNVAYVIYTSGSTGKPRGVLLTHRGLVNHHTAARNLYALEPSDRVLQFSSISFDIAVEEIFPTWVAGATVVLRREDMPLDVAGFLRCIRRQGITVLDLPTAYWHELVHELPECGERLPDSLRLVIVGGEKASAVAFASWRSLAGDRVRWINTYGPSENSIIATAYEPRRGEREIPAELPIGRPIANTRVYILDAHLQPVPVGVAGELHIGGDGVARGYLNRPELTAEKFVADPFSDEPGARLYKTGDFARYLPDGNIEFRGRSDDQVKIRGFRVELGEIEAVLGKHPGLREVVVLVRESASGDKRLVSYVVPASSAPPTAGDLRAFLKERLPEFMLPAAFVMLDEMPLTPNGKIDRRALASPEQITLPLDERVATPKDALESKLVEIWEELLGTRPIGVNQNFFELGGHSLLAVRLLHRIDKVLGKKLPIAILLQAPTVEQLAAALRQDGWSPRWSSLVPIQTGGSKPPFFCVHGLGGTVMRFYALAHHLGPDQPVYGLQAQGLDPAYPCHTRVEDMATHYLAEMRSVQPKGPYHIGGYSFGGLVAVEMARRLLEEGKDVGLVVLFDAFPGKPKSNSSLLFKFLRTPPQQWIPYLWKKVRGHVRWYINTIWFPRRMVEVWDACFQAERAYVPRVYPGRLTLFRPSEKSLRSHENSHGGWEEWAAGGVEAHEITGDHGSITREPKVRLLAAELRACLDKAQATTLKM